MNPLDWVYPPRCMCCRNLIPVNQTKQRARFLCSHCSILLEPLPKPLCPRCGHPLNENGACPSCDGKSFHFESNISICAYEGALREAIHDMKFRSRRWIAQGIGTLLSDALVNPPAFDFLVPVPMHKTKQRKRGFNQAEMIARVFSKRSGIPVLNALTRTRGTVPQSGLSAAERQRNVSGAFKINSKFDISNKHICLIDDIFTTGATLNACASVLKEAGASAASCITFSIAIIKKKD